MTLTVEEKGEVIKLVQKLRTMHRREMWALSALWLIGCLACGAIGALGGYRSLAVVLLSVLTVLASTLVWNWTRRATSNKRKP